MAVAGIAARTVFADELSEGLPPGVISVEPGLSEWLDWFAVRLAPVLISIALTTAAWLIGRRHLGFAWCLAVLAVVAAVTPFWPMEWGGRADYGD